MPVPVAFTELAASIGQDRKRESARRELALSFFKEHLYDRAEKKNWGLVLRAMQCVDFRRPLTFGPKPPAPARLVSAGVTSPLGAGFFSQAAPSGAGGQWWAIPPEAPYMQYFAKAIDGDSKLASLDLVRYFIPATRTNV